VNYLLIYTSHVRLASLVKSLELSCTIRWGKSLAKRLLQRIGKKTLWLNVDLHHQSSINSKTKPNEAIPNIHQHNKINSVFSRICIVPCASSLLFDDGEVHCRVYEPWLSQIYKQTFTWKWTGPHKILQYRYPYLDHLYLDPYAKQIKVHLTLLRVPHVTKTGKLAENFGKLDFDLPNSP